MLFCCGARARAKTTCCCLLVYLFCFVLFITKNNIYQTNNALNIYKINLKKKFRLFITFDFSSHYPRRQPSPEWRGAILFSPPAEGCAKGVLRSPTYTLRGPRPRSPSFLRCTEGGAPQGPPPSPPVECTREGPPATPPEALKGKYRRNGIFPPSPPYLPTYTYLYPGRVSAVCMVKYCIIVLKGGGALAPLRVMGRGKTAQQSVLCAQLTA